MPVTATTAQEIFIGAGDVYIDGVLAGATMGNNVFRVVQQKGTPELNGVAGPLIGLDYIQSETAELEVTMPELGADKLALAVPGAVSTVGDAIGVAAGAGGAGTLFAGSLAGATNIKVTSVDALAQGDVIQIGAAGAREFRKIVTVGTIEGGSGLELDVALAKPHTTGDAYVEVVSGALAADAAIGSTNIKVTSVTGLVTNDYLRFGYPGEQEVRRLTAVGTINAGGTGVSFAEPTAFAHRAGDATIEQTNEGATTIASGTGLSRRIPTSAYHEVELRVAGLDGREARFRLLSAIMADNPEFEATDNPANPMAPRLRFQARWNPATSTVSPWEIDKIGPTV